ncbi:hypothetical protein BV25DRAFT_1911030 [Artomyces pyxidatus]|uniref:Uncharacterized protein n=1 Tax=Artomyces pyxidatus TaxID=48021 RepID=A0ACB8THV1_9AGAM|nr:hypothetical protein BV25DRAFT_1911030 [Artomyces pyxidatus]
MSSQAYAAPSTSGGFFPTGPSAPHAFSTMHASPRDSHAMRRKHGEEVEQEVVEGSGRTMDYIGDD